MNPVYKDVDSCILFVGEGDFSFSANYILKRKDYKERVFASCLKSGFLTDRQQKNIEVIEQNGGLVYTDVDATCLESHPEINKFHFSKIIFNFPHIPGKMNIRNNRQLVQQFLISAVKIIEDSGAIYVTLCQGQGGTEIEKVKRKWSDTWQIVRLAASAALILYEVKCFDVKEFKTYRCTGFRGLQKPFNTTGALTHIFKRGKLVDINIENVKRNAGIIDIYIQDCITHHKFIKKNLCQPSFNILSLLNGLWRKIFCPFDQVTVDDLLICKKSSINLDLDFSMDIDYCQECMINLFTLFLTEKSSRLVNSVSCNLCCLKNINLTDNSVHHLLSYFSDDTEYLLTNLPAFLKHLTQVYTLNREKKMSAPENESYFHNKKIISTLIHDNQGSVSRKLSVRSVANLYAKYSIHKGDELFYYFDVDIFLLTDNILNYTDVKEGDKIMKIGSILQYNNFKTLNCILLNLNTLSCLKYHIMDHRILFSEQSSYCSHEVFGSIEKVYRTLSLYPPTYVHDTSFYIEQDFDENNFFMVVRNTVGLLIKFVSLIDSYYDKKMQKHSRCYQFVYQSCDLALTKENANEIHTVLMRRALQNLLNICLR